MSLTRRTALGAALAASALGARAEDLQDAAPSASNPGPWIAYEQRLRDRLEDAGGGRFDEATARELLKQHNTARRDADMGPLAWRDDLARTACAHAADLAHRAYFDHLSPEGFDPSHRCWLLARRLIGSPAENIGYRRASKLPTSRDLMTGWRHSPPHWRNLLSPAHTHVGFGVVRQGDTVWAVGLYARPHAELARPMPFQPASYAEVEAAIGDGLPPGARVTFARPQGSRGSPRMMQISVRRSMGDRRVELVGGPIFVAPRVVPPTSGP